MAPHLPVPPKLDPGVTPDGSLVTLTVAEARLLTTYLERVAETSGSLDGCNLITWSAQ